MRCASVVADHARARHLAEDLVAAGLGGARAAQRRVQRRRLRQAGEHRGLAQRQLAEALVEVDPRGGLRADRRLAADGAVRDGVEVLVEDPGLGVLVLDLLRDLGLADLALVGALVGDVEVAGELHRDRRAALHGLLVDEVLHARADEALVVDALVLVEAAVLDRDGRVLEQLRELVARGGQAQLGRLDEAEPRAVGGQHLGVGARVALLQRGQRRRGGGDRDDVADGGDAAHADDARPPPGPRAGPCCAHRRLAVRRSRVRLERLMRGGRRRARRGRSSVGRVLVRPDEREPSRVHAGLRVRRAGGPGRARAARTRRTRDRAAPRARRRPRAGCPRASSPRSSRSSSPRAARRARASTSASGASQTETSTPTASASSVSLRRIPLARRSLGITMRVSLSVRRIVKFSRTSSTWP